MQQREHWHLSQTSIISPAVLKLQRIKKRSYDCAPFMSPEVKKAQAIAAT